MQVELHPPAPELMVDRNSVSVRDTLSTITNLDLTFMERSKQQQNTYYLKVDTKHSSR